MASQRRHKYMQVLFNHIYIFFAFRDSWPELLGADGDSAAATTKKENKNNVDAIVIKVEHL